MLFRVRIQCDSSQPDSAVWNTARAVSEMEGVSTHAVDPYRRQFGACLTTEGYLAVPFHRFVAELRNRALQVLSAEERHQSECEWHPTDIPS